MLFLLFVLAAISFGNLAGEFGELGNYVAAVFCGAMCFLSAAFAVASIVEIAQKWEGPDDDKPSPA